MGLLDFLGFGNRTKQIAEFVAKDAVIIDVRTLEEFNAGHIANSKNIPLDVFSSKINDIKKLNKPVIACCRSGRRSGIASKMLIQNGIETMNGGGWVSLESKLNI
jgi:phage shock protein E